MKPPANTPVVALFVRVPVPGRVKTRLAGDLGEEGACHLYRAMVTDILGHIRVAALPLYLFHDGQEGSALPEAWVEASVQVRAQTGKRIGEKMAAAFEHCFAAGIEQVVLVGSDIPGLDAAMLGEAAGALASHDAAIVPVVDGGYCLMALRRSGYRRKIFANISWSTDQVLPATLQRFEQCQLTVCLLPMLQDIDTLADLKAYWQKPSPRALATNRVIEQTLGKTEKSRCRGT